MTSQTSRIAIVDTEVGSLTYLQVVGHTETDTTVLNQVAVSPEGSLALVANNTADVLVIDLASNAASGGIPVASSTFGVVFAEGVDNVVACVSRGGGAIRAITELP